jgi:hypothetical protein
MPARLAEVDTTLDVEERTQFLSVPWFSTQKGEKLPTPV